MSLPSPSVSAIDVATGVTVGGVVTLGPVPGGSGLVTAITTDYATSGGNTRYNMHQTTLNPSVDTNNIWENDNSFLTLNGPGHALHEINIKHTYFQNNIGATAVQVEGYEASMLNNGSIGTYDSFLGVMNNGTTGVVTGVLQNINLGLNNDNTTAGSIAKYIGINFAPWTGAGTVPAINLAIQNSDSTAGIVTLGNVGLGSVTPPALTTSMQIVVADNLNTSFSFVVKSPGAKQPFTIDNTGTVRVLSNIIIGSTGASPAGTISLLNATSGSIKLAPPTGALGAGTLFLPITATSDTLVCLANPQAFTALQTFRAHVAGAKITTLPVITNGTIDATGSDLCGTVTGGTTVTGITVTFETAYATTPHAVVSSRDGVTFTYTVSTTALTLTFASSTGRVFDYHVIQ